MTPTPGSATPESETLPRLLSDVERFFIVPGGLEKEQVHRRLRAFLATIEARDAAHAAELAEARQETEGWENMVAVERNRRTVSLSLLLRRPADDSLTCMFCWGPRCEWETTLRLGGRTAIAGVHDVCADKLTTGGTDGK